MKKKFIFYDELKDFYNDSHIVEIDFGLIKTKSDLLEKYYDSLQFPGYFGFNWDALSDMLRDLYWLDERKILINHFGDVDDFKEVDLKIYIDILQQVSDDWLNDDGDIMVFFSNDLKEKIKGFVSN